MKKVTLIIPEGYDKLIGITLIGHKDNGMIINASNMLYPIPDETTIIDCDKIIREKEREQQ